MGNYVVYMHISPSGKKYIGITCQKPEKRWGYGNKYEHNDHIKNAIKKYGWNNFEHKILFDNLTKEEAEQKEIELIAYYKSNQREYGYNIEPGGNHNGKKSQETIEKFRKARLGIKRGPMSEETKQKLSEAMKGKPAWNKGKKYTVKEKEKISIGTRKAMKDKGFLKKVICIETNIIYQSIQEASEKTNCYYSGISRVCNGKLKKVKGLTFKFIN